LRLSPRIPCTYIDKNVSTDWETRATVQIGAITNLGVVQDVEGVPNIVQALTQVALQ
jgi:hypothetical protein